MKFYTIYRYDGVGPSDTTYAMLHGEGPAVRGAAAALAACKPLADLLARAVTGTYSSRVAASTATAGRKRAVCDGN